MWGLTLSHVGPFPYCLTFQGVSGVLLFPSDAIQCSSVPDFSVRLHVHDTWRRLPSYDRPWLECSVATVPATSVYCYRAMPCARITHQGSGIPCTVGAWGAARSLKSFNHESQRILLLRCCVVGTPVRTLLRSVRSRLPIRTAILCNAL